MYDIITCKGGDNMSRKKPIEFIDAQKYVTDKDINITSFIEYQIDKLQQMFEYKNLPDTIPQEELERYLLKSGHCFITRVDGDLYALKGGFSGIQDAYERPRFYTVTNVALNLSETYEIGIDGVLFKNDYNLMGVLPLLKKYGSLLCEADISMNTATILSRISMLISAPDDKTKSSADLFLSKIINGEFTIIGENGFFDGVKLQVANIGNSQYITQYIELMQYYKACYFNELGLNANYNMKRERLTDDEVSLNVDAIYPFVDNMFRERTKAVEAINEMFGTDIEVTFNSIWKANSEELEQTIEAAELPIEELQNDNSDNSDETNESDENVEDDSTEVDESEEDDRDNKD